jgi:hypothetical protein
MMGWYGAGTGPLDWLMMGVFVSFLFGLVLWLVARLLPGSGGGMTRGTGESALETLDRRLASGEIDLGAWETARAALMATRRDTK